MLLLRKKGKIFAEMRIKKVVFKNVQNFAILAPITSFVRNSRLHMFFKIDFLKILMFFKLFAIFTGKYLCWSLLFNKVEGLRSAALLKKRLKHRCFPVKFEKF